MIEKIISLIKSDDFREFVIYGFIGVLGLFIDFGLFWLLTKFTALPVEVANFISSSCALVNNFYMNTYLNFHVRDHLLSRFIKYYIIGQITTLITTTCLFIFVTLMHQNEMVVKVISTFLATMLQFVVNKVFTFKKEEL
ncbi:GtrA family protein [Lactobacillus jensenii]|uniref:GtrA family protein n=1 Tax=Lactobacillus jensenii TaxID=109790 RepID=UPI001F09D504|nr:GtrA family protein [Lactobacillus jensenii]